MSSNPEAKQDLEQCLKEKHKEQHGIKSVPLDHHQQVARQEETIIVTLIDSSHR